MQITIPAEIELAARNKAEATGFRTVEEYIVDLIVADQTAPISASVALKQLRELRQQVPRMTDAEIVALVGEGRDRCP